MTLRPAASFAITTGTEHGDKRHFLYHHPIREEYDWIHGTRGGKVDLETGDATMKTSYIPNQYTAPTADAAFAVLELIAENLRNELPRGPLKRGALVELVIEEIGKHVGPIGVEDRKRWTNAIKNATTRMENEGHGCLEYHPPQAKGGHGVYLFKNVESFTSSSAVAEREDAEADGNARAYVYAWCLPSYQSDEVYPVKLGRTERHPKERVVDNLTDLPEEPNVLMSIPCETQSDAEKTEWIFHHVLRMRGTALRSKDEIGREWFRTNIDELREIGMFIYGNRFKADCVCA